jgi:hypothetical protein
MITIDEQIAYKKHVIRLLESIESPRAVENEQAILASLQRLKAIDAVQVPEEPNCLTEWRHNPDIDRPQAVLDYIDTLRDLLRLEKEKNLNEFRARTWLQSRINELEENEAHLNNCVARANERAEAAEAKLDMQKQVSAALGRLVEDKDKDRIYFRDKLAAVMVLGAEPSEEIRQAMVKASSDIATYKDTFKAGFAKLIEQAGVKK